jgi:NAD(P)H-hydrate repair Nnr-like enzyme with NAD(P)H-hydrate dehydratase domain
VDAGALDLVAEATAPLIVTPHAGEFARLREMMALPTDGTRDRVADVAETARVLGRPVLLKGATTLIAAPDAAVISVAAAPGWLATAGSGDVLAGTLGALLAANSESRTAEVAAAAAWLHGHAAALASGVEAGGPGHPIVALDVAAALPAAFEDLLS